MGLDLTISITGDKQFARTLGVKREAVRDMRPAWRSIEKILNAFGKRQFASSGASDGLRRWAPLKESTQKQKPPNLRNKPLILSGKLRDALSSSNSFGSLRVKEKLQFVWGIDEFEIPYAVHHQFGTRKMPRRSPVRLTSQMRRLIVNAMHSHIVKSGQFERINL
jgi:hypothetical protein